MTSHACHRPNKRAHARNAKPRGADDENLDPSKRESRLGTSNMARGLRVRTKQNTENISTSTVAPKETVDGDEYTLVVPNDSDESSVEDRIEEGPPGPPHPAVEHRELSGGIDHFASCEEDGNSEDEEEDTDAWADVQAYDDTVDNFEKRRSSSGTPGSLDDEESTRARTPSPASRRTSAPSSASPTQASSAPTPANPEPLKSPTKSPAKKKKRKEKDADDSAAAVAGLAKPDPPAKERVQRSYFLPPPGSNGAVKFVIYDIETTGPKKNFDEIIEIAMLVCRSDGSITGEFVRRIKVNVDVDDVALSIHGISNSDVANEQNREQVSLSLTKAQHVQIL